ncbi:MAG: hypothetical protein ACO1OB_17835 [Archangium sp.]
MIRISLAVAVLTSTFALAQPAAITVQCGDCGAFQGIQLNLDGTQIGGVSQAPRIIDIEPGEHELKVIKWVSPFKTDVLFEGVITFPRGTELRAKASKAKWDVFGRGSYTPAAPVVTGPNPQQIDTARGWLDEANESLEELQERVEDGDDACVGKLSGRLGSLEDALRDAKQNTDRAWIDAALNKAADAQKVLTGKCEKKTAKKWGKSLDRVVSKLQNAQRAL